MLLFVLACQALQMESSVWLILALLHVLDHQNALSFLNKRNNTWKGGLFVNSPDAFQTQPNASVGAKIGCRKKVQRESKWDFSRFRKFKPTGLGLGQYSLWIWSIPKLKGSWHVDCYHFVSVFLSRQNWQTRYGAEAYQKLFLWGQIYVSPLRWLQRLHVIHAWALDN